MRIFTAIVVVSGVVLLSACGGPNTPPSPSYPADRAEYWAAMGRCEQPGDGWGGVQWDIHGPTYEGGLGFYVSTWDHWRPEDFPENAGDATPEQQMIVADRIYDDVGPGAWGCSRTVGERP